MYNIILYTMEYAVKCIHVILCNTLRLNNKIRQQYTSEEDGMRKMWFLSEGFAK